MTSGITVSQLDAVHRQLSTAIELWLEDGDPVSIHTLSFAAYQIVHDLNRHRKGPALLLDSDLIKPEMKQEFVSIVKRDSNYFKHADDRGKKKKSPDSIVFYPEINEVYFSYILQGIKFLGEQLTPQEQTLMTWQAIQRPDLINDAWRSAIEQTVSTENLQTFRSLHKKAFFERALQIVGAA